MDLERYMIAQESHDLDDLKSEMIAGGILLAPLAITAIIRRLKDKKNSRIMQAKADADKLKTEKERNLLIEINDRIKTQYPDVWKREKAEREKAYALFEKQIRSMASKNKKLPTGLWYGSFRDAKELAERRKELANGFLTNPIPLEYPINGYYSVDSSGDWYFDAVFEYDIWLYVDEHEGVNARNMEDCAEFWEAMNNMVKEVTNVVKSNKFYDGVECLGDWDEGSFGIMLKPSDEILRIAQSMGAMKWPKKTNH